jgi:uncharacterized protein (DUF885 family)
MRRMITLALAAALLTACGSDLPQPAPAPATAPAAAPTAESTAAETERLNQWFEARYEESLDFSPMRRTFLGEKKHYDRIDDVSEASEDAQLAWRRKTVEDLKANFDYEQLTPEARTSWDVWVYELESAERALPFRRRQYVFNQMQGVQSFLPAFMMNFHRVDDLADMEAWIARIGGIARMMDQLVERATINAGEGVRPPRFAYDGVLEQARAVITGAPFGGEGEAALYADARAKIAALQSAGSIDEAKAAELLAAAEAALTGALQPSYQRLIAFVEADLPNAAEIATGVHTLPQGQAFYNERLAASTTTDMTAEQIHAFGLAEVARIHAEMETIKQQVGFEGTLQELFVHMREDDRFFFPDTDEGREAYLEAARQHLEVINQRLPEFFGILPKADLQVKRVEPFREQKGAAQHYFPGTPDGSRPGIYYAHLSDMRAMPKHQLEVIAYHEGNPGHHMQISIAQELQDMPRFRTQAGFTAYSEGWALYSELLAKEMGAYEDPYSDLGRLSTELWRAIRLVVDSGLHAKGWTEQEAVDYFVANSPSAEGAIRSEIQRYIVWPGQATAYKVGMQKIQDLRARAEEALGERFDIRGFHDTVLGGGALPLSILERRVNDWVAAQKNGTAAPAG